MENQPIEPGEIQLGTTLRLVLPQPRTAMPIYLDDWEDLGERVESCKVSLQPWSIAYSVAFAVGVTAGLSILPLAFANLPSWVMTVYIAICALGLGIGVICVIAERVLAKTQHSQIEDLIGHMERLKQQFPATTT